MGRSYRLGKRGENAAQSRDRVVEVARQLLTSAGFHNFSVESLAEAAGVSRATIYNQFASKTGILEAIIQDIGQRIEFHHVHEAIAEPDPRRALRRTVIECCHAWARDYQVIGRVSGLAAVDPELARLLENYETMRRAPIGTLVERLRQDGALRPGVSPAEAHAALSALTSFTTYQQLVIAGLAGPGLHRILQRLAAALFDLDPPAA